MKKTTKILASILSKGQLTRLIAGQLPHKLFLILKRYNIIIPLFLAVLLTSCTQEIVVPIPPEKPTIKDSAMFDWQYIPLYNYRLTGLYVADTNKIFISAINGILYYDGQNFTNLIYNDPDFAPSITRGLDEYNVYFGGSSFALPYSKLKKWNGNSFETIEVPQDSSMDIEDILVLDVNNIWLATTSKIVYNYNGTIILSTYLPYRLSLPKLFKDISGDVYLFGHVPSNQGFNYNFYTFKLVNNQWNQILADSGSDNSELLRYLNICGTDAIRGGSSTVYSFTGSGWEALKPSIEFKGTDFGGTSKNDFLCVGENENFNYLHKIYYYNGNEWFNQSNYMFYGAIIPLMEIQKKHNNYYGIYISPEPTWTHLVMARPKKQ